MRKFEYTAVPIAEPVDEKRLDVMGEKGWELVQLERVFVGGSQNVMSIWKREKSAEDEQRRATYLNIESSNITDAAYEAYERCVPDAKEHEPDELIEWLRNL